MNFSEGKQELVKALVGFAHDVTNPSKNKQNTHLKTAYATLDHILDHIRPILQKHGLAVYQDTTTSEDKLHVGSKTIVIHESGHMMESSYLWLPAYKLGKNGVQIYDAQAAGIAATYSRRYSLVSTLNLASDEDDDGNANSYEQNARQQRRQPPQKPQPAKQQAASVLSKAQLNEIISLLNEKRGEKPLNEFYNEIQAHFKMEIPMEKLKPTGAKLVIDYLKGL